MGPLATTTLLPGTFGNTLAAAQLLQQLSRLLFRPLKGRFLLWQLVLLAWKEPPEQSLTLPLTLGARPLPAADRITCSPTATAPTGQSRRTNVEMAQSRAPPVPPIVSCSHASDARRGNHLLRGLRTRHR